MQDSGHDYNMDEEIAGKSYMKEKLFILIKKWFTNTAMATE